MVSKRCQIIIIKKAFHLCSLSAKEPVLWVSGLKGVKCGMSNNNLNKYFRFKVTFDKKVLLISLNVD